MSLRRIVTAAFLLGFAGAACAQNYSGPESAEYHVCLDRHLVSNTSGGNILARAADGTLSVFTSAPTAPYGIELVAGVLWVLDSGRLKGYDIDTATPVADIPIPGASFLNGITSNGTDRLWISDFSAKRIHPVDISNPALPVPGTSVATVPTPNGLVYDRANERLLIATWSANARIQSLDLTTPGATPVDLIQTTLTSFDGITLDCRGSIIVSAWGNCGAGGSPAGCLRRFDPPFTLGSTPVVLANNLGNPADIDFAWPKGQVGVPESSQNKVTLIDAPGCDGSLFYADFER